METIHIVYKPSMDGELLLKYYRGYPISYYPIYGGYHIFGRCPKGMGDYHCDISKRVDREVMKERIALAIKNYELSIDKYIEDNDKEREMFMDVASGKYVLKSKPVEVVKKRRTLIEKLLGVKNET